MKLKVERTVSWQVEGPGESYCATTYSKPDALLVRDLARNIPHLRCLREGKGGKQPKGIYQYIRRKGHTFPAVETYDARLAKLVREHAEQLRGDV